MEADGEGRPIAITLGGRRLAATRVSVLQVQDTWRIDDEWWRERPVSRVYFEVSLEDGRTVTVYQDMVSERWYQQGYNNTVPAGFHKLMTETVHRCPSKEPWGWNDRTTEASQGS